MPDGRAMPSNPRFRVRRLSQTGSGVVESVAPMRGAGVLTAASAHAGAVYDIASHELLLTHDEVIAGLQTGRLQTTDLVHFDDRWWSLVESPPFADEAVKHAGGEGFRRNLPHALLVLAAAGFLMLLIVLRMFGAMLG